MDGSIVFFPVLFAVVLALLLFFLSKWIPRRRYGIPSVTRRGEMVKSIGERRIADYFHKNNIRYVYEREATARTLFLSYKIGTPDFYLPDFDVYVEYWGLVDAEDLQTRTRYVRYMKRKMAIYYKNHIKFISIYPRNLDNLDWIFRRKFRDVTGLDISNS